MMRCARAVSSHRLGSSASVFSSARRAFALSMSKVPPQQSDRPIDVFDDALSFRAHDAFRLWHFPPMALFAYGTFRLSRIARFWLRNSLHVAAVHDLRNIALFRSALAR